MLTKVYLDWKFKNYLGYTLPPKEALVAAYEQEVNKNFNTWTYKHPDDYPIEKKGNYYTLKGLAVHTEEAQKFIKEDKGL